VSLSNPQWCAAECLGRVRARFAPQDGVRIGRIGSLRFEYDFGLDPSMRQMCVGAYEHGVVGLMRSLLRPGDTFVDVGANVGYLSCVGAQAVGPQGRVLSFEPIPRYHERLRKCIEMNPGYQWDAFQHAVGERDHEPEMAMSRGNIGWNTIVPGQIPLDQVRESFPVRVRALDSCLHEAGVERVRLLKVDTEGYEGSVFAGFRDYLSGGSVDHIIAEINKPAWEQIGSDFERAMADLADWGYDARDTRRPYRAVDLQDLHWAPDIWFARRGAA
jgi:FkbM family methyltransferase